MSYVTMQSDVVEAMARRGLAAIAKARQLVIDEAVDEAMNETTIFGKERYATREAALEAIKNGGLFNAYNLSRMMYSESKDRIRRLLAMTKASMEVHVTSHDFEALNSWNREEA